jgi:IPT/TIG domain/Putative Ig domain
MNRSIWLALALTILAAGCGIQGPLQVGTSSLPDAAVQQTYAAQLVAIWGGAPLTWSVASGTLPPGLSLSDNTGLLSGSPQASGEFNFSIRVTADTTPPISALSRPLKIVVKKAGAATNLRIITTRLASGTDKTLYDATLSAVGGNTPYTWSVASGALPPGVTLSSSAGILAGTPTSSGSFSFTVDAKDSSHPTETATQALSISIGSSTSQLGISTSSLPSGEVQSTYGAALTATGGTAPYSWSLASGSLPPGLALSSSTGALAGMPTTAGTFSFTVGVADSSAQHATRALSVSIAATAPSLRITTSSLPSGAVQVAYSAVLAATGGSTPYSWSVGGGTLPAGLALSSSTGAITGTPTQAGSFSFTAQVKDSAGATTSASLNASIAPPASPVLSGISPTSGPTSGGTVVTIGGSNFVSGAAVFFGGTASGSVKVVSSGEIQAVSPAEIAGTVTVSVQENGQTGTASGGFTYNALTPTVAAISPSSGPTAGGTQVTITGNNFLAGALVLFGTVSASSVTVSGGSQIQAVTPPNAAGPADVVVANPGNLSGKLSGGFTYNSTGGPPSISSISPTSGPAGTRITITGTNFETGATVLFGSTNASSVSFVSSTQLQVSVPSIPTGSYNLTVTDPDPASATLNNAFTVTTPPPAQSLLSGCTVSAANTPSCSVPSGWTLVAAQGFDDGSLPSNQALGQGNSTSCSFGHTGSCSVQGTYSYNGAGVDWSLSSGSLGSFSEVYLSWWDYLASNGAMNDEMFQAHFLNRYSDGGFQELILDNFPCSSYLFNCSDGEMVAEAQATEGGGYTHSYYGPGYTLGWGSWVQWEVDWTPNTPGNSDGTLNVYRNGALFFQLTNTNFTGTASMTGMSVEVGGVYTKSVWTSNGQFPPSGVCSSKIGSGTEASGGWQGSFGSVSSSSDCAPAPPIFNRNLDDIIILKK